MPQLDEACGWYEVLDDKVIMHKEHVKHLQESVWEGL